MLSMGARMISFAVLVAVAATLLVSTLLLASMVLTPTYEAWVVVRVDPKDEVRSVVDDISSRSVAKETIRRLGLEMSEGELLSNLSAKPHADVIFLTQEGDEPGTPTRIALTLPKAASDLISSEARLETTMVHRAKGPVIGAAPAPLRFPLLPLLILAACLAALVFVHADREARLENTT